METTSDHQIGTAGYKLFARRQAHAHTHTHSHKSWKKCQYIVNNPANCNKRYLQSAFYTTHRIHTNDPTEQRCIALPTFLGFVTKRYSSLVSKVTQKIVVMVLKMHLHDLVHISFTALSRCNIELTLYTKCQLLTGNLISTENSDPWQISKEKPSTKWKRSQSSFGPPAIQSDRMNATNLEPVHH